jgi:hypothetical protein
VTAEAAGWVAATASVRGASHERSGKPNQDAVRVVEVAGPTPGLVAAVSDGHGGDRYVRSDVGSRLGVEVACSVGRRALETLGPLPSAAAVESHLAREMATAIVDHWRRRVLDHVERHPFSSDEEERAGGPLASDPLIAYGCTLVVALLAPSWVGLLQIGDGDVTVVRGASAVAPVPGDDRLVGGETTSLCLPTAAADARVAVIGDPLPDMVILSSDGYANSFASPTWRSEVGVDLRDHVNRIGIDGVEQRLPAWLAESAVAAGDDVSMALIQRTAASSGSVPIAAEPDSARPARAGVVSQRTVAFVALAALLGLGAGWFAADARDGRPVDSSVLVTTATDPTTGTTDLDTTVPSTDPATTDVSTTVPTSEPETGGDDAPALEANDQVHLFIGDDTGVIIVFDPSSPETPNARSLAWVTFSNRPSRLLPPWEFSSGSVLFDGDRMGSALAAAQPTGMYVWVVEPDRLTLKAFDAETGDLAGTSTIREIGDIAEVDSTSGPTPTQPRGAPRMTETP